LWFVGACLVLLWLAMNVLQTPQGQTWLAKKATAYLSKELKTKVHIDRLMVHFGTSVDLFGLYVEDLHHDTLLYAGALRVKIQDLKVKDKFLSIRKVTLKDATFNLSQYKGESHDNLQFILDYFAGDTTAKDTTTAPWKVQFDPSRGSLELANVHFRHDIHDDTAYIGMVDFSHLDVRSIHGTFNKIRFEGDAVFVTIDKLRLADHSGFRLDELSVEAKVAPDEMRLNKLTIRTPTTDIHTDLTFGYRDFTCFNDFLTCIRFKSDFRDSKVSFSDIAYFASDVKTMKLDLHLTGKFKGTVSNFKGKDVDIRFGEKSFFQGNVAMNGLPDINETYMEFDAKELRTNKKDIEAVRLPGAEPGNRIVLPDNIAKLGTVSFKGRFTGFFKDFVAYGNMKTDIGYITSDINLKFKSGKNEGVYSGHLATTNFNVGSYWSIPGLGEVTLSADINGSGLALDNLTAKLQGTIGSMVYRNYDYRNIEVSANMSKKLFNGMLAIHEPNIDLDFQGDVNFQGKLPVFNFVADLKSMQLDKLNLFSVQKDVNLSARTDIELTGDKIDNLVGAIHIQQLNYREEKTLFHMNNLDLYSDIESSGSRDVTFRSDVLDADFHGHFEFATLGSAFSQVLPIYLPALLPLKKPVVARQDFDFNIRLKNASLLTNLVLPGWDFDANTTLNGHFNSIQNSFHFRAQSQDVRFTNFHFRNASFTGSTESNRVSVNLAASRLYYSETGFVEQPSLNAVAADNKISFALRLADSAVYNHSGYFRGALAFQTARNFTLAFDSTHLMLNHDVWSLNPGNRVEFDSSAIAIHQFDFMKSGEKISFDGRISKNDSDKMAVQLTNFRLLNLKPFLDSSSIELAGIANGSVSMRKGSHQTTMFQSDLTLDSLLLNKDTLGTAIIRSAFDDENKVLSMRATIQRGATVVLSIDGDYLTAKKEDNLDFDIKLNGIYLNTLSKYVSDVVSDLRGKASAEVRLTGSLSQPVFKGDVHLVKASCLVNYLGTRYSFTNDVKVEENRFVLDNFILHDLYGKEAVVNGTIHHDYFKRFVFDVGLRAKEFECLNTTAIQNSLYYGKAVASGFATFKGMIENMNINITLSSRKGTLIAIPLGGGSEISQSGFITFLKTSGDSAKDNENLPWTNPSGVNLEMSFNVTPDAELQLIFDEKIGDVISGNGNGDIRLVVTDDGTFKMYGNYVIDKGSYLFTLRNVINKRFQIEKGGYISWTGDPYDADINMDATYRVYTSTLYSLINDSTFKKRLAVDCKLNLTNKLMNPTIRYSIDVPGVDGATQSQISSVLNSEAEVSKQFFGLLVLNQFIPQGTSNQAATAFDASLGANASELLSNQFNNWLSRLSTDFSLGVNYRARDAYSSEQVQLMISKSFMNDRLTVDGTFGLYNSTATQTASNPLGDFNAEYKVSNDGRFRVKAYNHSNENYSIEYNSPYTQGLGVSYREEFDSLKELLIRWRLAKKKEEPTAPAAPADTLQTPGSH